MFGRDCDVVTHVLVAGGQRAPHATGLIHVHVLVRVRTWPYGKSVIIAMSWRITTRGQTILFLTIIIVVANAVELGALIVNLVAAPVKCGMECPINRPPLLKHHKGGVQFPYQK